MKRESYTPIGYDAHCGGLVLTGLRGAIATCQGCGLFSSVQWWRQGQLVARSERRFRTGACDRHATALGERVARPKTARSVAA